MHIYRIAIIVAGEITELVHELSPLRRNHLVDDPIGGAVE